MTRSFDTIPNDLNRAAEAVKPSPSPPVMSVCPFCGAISEKADGPCLRCKMENSAMTRQATRARVGPWYVMQSRNPSAPGMKCSTLLALIRKGQITPRSVIRGPTTYQLWRFAARVKGISREFGLCYSCGGEVQRTSTFCARCSRSQELPPNPDALLEHENQAAKALFREVKSSRPPSPGSAERSRPENTRDEPIRVNAAESDSHRGNRSQTQIPSAAETMAELADLPSPHNAPSDLQTRPRQRPQDGVLSARDLAAAFSLQYDPTMDAGPRRRGPGGGLGKRVVAVAAMFLIFGGVAATFYYVPSLRQRMVDWVQDASPPSDVSTVTHELDAQPQKSLTAQTPAWMMPPPVDSPPITTPLVTPKPQPGDVPALSYNLPSVPKPVPIQQVDQPAPPVVQTAHDAEPPHDSQPATPTTAANVIVPESNDAGAVAAAANTQKLRQSAGGDLDTLAMELRGNGMDAEHRDDFAAAEYYYQQVEQLPRDHWPGDIDQLLKDAHQKVLGGDTR
jgi:hypothetical protein